MKKALLLFAFVTVVFSTASLAQFRLKLGPSVGMNFNLHTGSDLSESGNGFGFVGGAVVDMSFSPTLGLITNLQFYDNRSGSTENERTVQFTDNNGNPINVARTDESSVSLAYFAIEPLLKITLPSSSFFFFVGPSLAFNVEGSREDETTFKLPAPFTWQETGTDTRTETAKGTLRNLNFRFGLKLGGAFDINLGGFYLTPGVGFEYGITKVQEDVEWRVLTVQGSVAFKFSVL